MKPLPVRVVKAPLAKRAKSAMTKEVIKAGVGAFAGAELAAATNPLAATAMVGTKKAGKYMRNRYQDRTPNIL
jgi:hypothetical protein